MGDDYTILSVQERNEWTSRYGSVMKDYAIQVQKAGSPAPEDGWVKLTQKLETKPPRPQWTLHGYIETETSNGTAYKKFKKVSPDGRANRSGSFGDSGGGQVPSVPSVNQQQLDYIVQMLEELTGRRDVVDDQKVKTGAGNAVTEPDPFEGLL